MDERKEKPDVNDKFQKMGEKLGWFKHKHLNRTKLRLSPSARRKKLQVTNTNDVNGCPTDRKDGEGKLMLKGKALYEQSEKTKLYIRHRPAQTNLAKALSFQAMLSSDSDSSFSNETDEQCSKGNPKAVLQTYGDSDEDVQPSVDVGTNSTSLSILPPPFDPILNNKPERICDIYCNDTLDLDTMGQPNDTLDLENIGEPLVESTRIHRRSSITYKKIVDSFHCFHEAEVSVVADYERNVDKINTDNGKCREEILDFVTSVCDETNYVTAIEKVYDTFNASTCNSSSDHCKTGNKYLGVDKESKETQDLHYTNGLIREGIPHGRSQKPDFDGERRTRDRKPTSKECIERTELDSCESGEEIEVMDSATQTEAVGNIDKDCATHIYESNQKMHIVYKEETVVDSFGNCTDFGKMHRKACDAYGEDTVEDSHIIVDDHFVNKIDDVGDNLELNRNKAEQSTVLEYVSDIITNLEDRIASTNADDYSKDTLQSKSMIQGENLYKNVTDEVNNNGVYEQETQTGNITDNDCGEVNVYEEETMPIIHRAAANVNNKSTKAISDVYDNVENNVGTLEDSLIEVNDAGTQTETVDDIIYVGTMPDGDEWQRLQLMDCRKENKEENQQCGLTDRQTEVELIEVLTEVISENSDTRGDDDENTDSRVEDNENTDSRVEDNENTDSRVEDNENTDSRVEDNENTDSRGEDNENTDSRGEDNENTDSRGEDNENSDSRVEDNENTDSRGEDNENTDSRGEDIIIESSDIEEASTGTVYSSHSSDDDDAYSTHKSVMNGRKKGEIGEDVIEQSWRSSERYSSDSSGNDNLEAFFQKMKVPEKKKSDSSSVKSIDDFIVEDVDISSESEDGGYYLETVEQQTRKDHISIPSNAIFHAAADDDDDDDNEDDKSDIFSSHLYPSSVTKHKKRKQISVQKQSNVSWTFSSDDEAQTGGNGNKQTTQKTSLGTKVKPINEKSKRIFQSKFDIETDSDSDDETFNIETSKPRRIARSRKYDYKNADMSISPTTKVSVTYSSNSEVGDRLPAKSDQPLFKTPKPLRMNKVVNDGNKENEFITPTKGRVVYTPVSAAYISLSSASEDESLGFAVTPSPSVSVSRHIPLNKGRATPSPSVSHHIPVNKGSATPKNIRNFQTPLFLKEKRHTTTTPLSVKACSTTCTFLESLSSTTENSRRHAEASRFVNSFRKNREELSHYLFRFYNQTVFVNKLPADLPVIWNKRLLRTAGYCTYKKNCQDERDRTTRIELSTKVCDTAERVRDTLIHEMCHAAVWLLNGVNGGHGSYWKYWARHATKVHTELPTISVCHSYSISTKFTYRCKRCGYSIGRHSKSLDVSKKVCGYCRGEFELLQNSMPTTPTSARSSAASTPRPPNKFALFVKDNYNCVKKQNQALKHGDVMKELSKLFAESKITS